MPDILSHIAVTIFFRDYIKYFYVLFSYGYELATSTSLGFKSAAEGGLIPGIFLSYILYIGDF